MKSILSCLAIAIVCSLSASAQPSPPLVYELACPSGYSPIASFGKSFNSVSGQWRANVCISDKGDGTMVCQMTGCGSTAGTLNEALFPGVSVGARVAAALASCGANPCTVLIPASETSTEVLGTNPTPLLTQIVWDMRNSGPGSTQATNWLVCDFVGTASDSPCRNGGGPQVFQFGRTFNNAGVPGAVGGTVDVKFTGVSANTLPFPLTGFASVIEANGLTQSNGTPAPLVNFDGALNIQGNNSTIPAWRMFSTDPGGLANAGTGNTITSLYGFYGQSCAGCVPAGLTVTNWYNGWFNWPGATGVTNAFSFVSDVRTWVSDGGFPNSAAQELLRVRGPMTGGGARTGDMFQVTDSAAADAKYFFINHSGITVAAGGAQVLQVSNGSDALFLKRFTDAAPTGLLIHAQNAALNTDLIDVDVTGKLTFENATVPGGGVGGSIPRVFATGTAAMTTAAIGAGACGTTVTVAAAGVLTTDVITTSFNAAPAGTNAGLTSWPTSGNVNFAYCPGVAETPAAATINWRVIR
jgi:hypothetical protein